MGHVLHRVDQQFVLEQLGIQIAIGCRIAQQVAFYLLISTVVKLLPGLQVGMFAGRCEQLFLGAVAFQNHHG